MADEPTRRVVTLILLASGALLTLGGVALLGYGRTMAGVAVLIAGVADLGLAVLMGRLVRTRVR